MTISSSAGRLACTKNERLLRLLGLFQKPPFLETVGGGLGGELLDDLRGLEQDVLGNGEAESLGGPAALALSSLLLADARIGGRRGCLTPHTTHAIP